MKKIFLYLPLLIWFCAVLILYCAFFLPLELIVKVDSNALKQLAVENVRKDGRTKTAVFDFYTPLDLPQEQRLVIKRLFPDRLVLKAIPENAESSIRSIELIRFGLIKRSFERTLDLPCSGGSLFFSWPLLFLLILLASGSLVYFYFESKYHWLECTLKERRPLFLTSAFLLVYFFFTNLLMYYQNPGDDWKFQCLGAYGFSKLPDVMQMRWQTWGVRILIDAFVSVVCSVSPLYFFCGIMLVIMGLVFFVSRLLRGNNPDRCLLPVGLLFLLFPFNVLTTAGWQSTMCFYALLLLLLFPLFFCIKDVLTGRDTPFWIGGLSFLCAFFLCNMELVCLSVILLTAGILIYCLLCKCRPSIWIPLNLLVGFLSLCCIFLCPGNKFRAAVEVSRGVSEILNLTLVQKGMLGAFSTLFYLNHCNMLWMFLLISIAVVIWLGYKNPVIRVIACFPLMVVLFSMNMPADLLDERLIAQIADFRRLGTFQMLAAMQMLSLFAILFLLILTQKNMRSGCVLAAGFLIALATRMAMGMTPAVYTSGERSFLYCYFGFLLAAVFLFDRISGTVSGENRRALHLTVTVFVLFLALKVFCVGILNCIRFSF